MLLKGAVTIHEVAAQAGVSITTVSRVLNNSEYPVRAETRQRVIAAVESLGFRPNPLALALLGKPTRTIALMIPDMGGSTYSALSRGVEDVASECGYALIFCNTDGSIQKIQRYLQVLREKRVDGVVFAYGAIEDPDDPPLMPEVGGKAVVVGRHPWPFPSIRMDDVQAACEATTHLIHLGHRHIAMIRGPVHRASAADRLRGYRRALAQAGIDFDESLLGEGDWSHESGYRAAACLLQMPERPTALFAPNDRMAAGAMAAAFDAGLRVPDDVAVVGFDDGPLAQYVRPAITSVAFPSYEMGRSAARLLLRLLAGESVEPVTWFSTTLMVRPSSDPTIRCCGNTVRGASSSPSPWVGSDGLRG